MGKKIRYVTANGIRGEMYLLLEKYINVPTNINDIEIETWDKKIYWTFQIRYKEIKSCINISKSININASNTLKKIQTFIEEFSKKINEK